MPKKFLTSIDLTNNSLLNGKIDARWNSTPTGSTNPDGNGTATTGQLSTYNGSLYVFNGTAWVVVGNPLSDSVSTTSSTTGASSTAVKTAYDRGSQGITDAAAAQTTANAALPKAGGTMSGAIAMGNNKITGLGTPTADGDAVTKAYVDNIAAGINVHESVKYATTGTLGTTGNLVGGTITTTYSNGTNGVGATLTIATSSNWTAITIDGQSLTVNDRVLIKNQASGVITGASNVQNGIYTVTTVGAVGNTTSFVFTRATDNDTAGEIDAGDLTYVVAGTTNGGDGYVQTATITTVGTDPITWTQYSGAGAVPYASTTTAGIASFPAAQFSVDAVGAVTIGTVNASVVNNGTGQISGARGGTGVDNTGKTITLGGNLTTATAAITLTANASGSSVTLPQSGTLLTTTGSGSSLTFGTGSLSLGANLTTATAAITLTANASGSSVTLPQSGTLLTTTGSGSSLTFGTGSLSLAGNLTTSGAFATTLTATAATTLTLPTSGTLVATSPSNVSGNGTSVSLIAGASTGTSGQAGGDVTITGGASTSGSSTNSGGSITITGGAANTSNGTGGSVTINGGQGSVTNGKGAVFIGTSNTEYVSIGGSVRLPGVGTSGFVKLGAGGALSADTNTYSRKTSGAGTGTSNTSFSVNHGFGQWVVAQLYLTSTGELVDVDITHASTSGGTTTFTAAANTNWTLYTYVIIG